MPRVDFQNLSHFLYVGLQRIVMLRLSAAMPSHVRWGRDVGARDTGDAAIGEVVVQKNKIGHLSIDR